VAAENGAGQGALSTTSCDALRRDNLWPKLKNYLKTLRANGWHRWRSRLLCRRIGMYSMLASSSRRASSSGWNLLPPLSAVPGVYRRRLGRGTSSLIHIYG
jgi:hypothetical protein